ncbi:MAG: multifunctional CCA addition/repair protein [Acidiferrobacterales bacterium]|jgi:tRNA nucleotidyltransferase (CCA-adding enzyme)|nr:multifunctional CCA addition/repair protein [Acidiferrobacterales bacterium]
MKTYLVGGAVRDKLLGLEVKDRDFVVVGATPEEMEAQGFKPVGADFPVFLHPQTKEEYALARTERKSGHGYKGFTVYASPDVTLEDDLRRRDLTINAMAEDESGEIIDPFGGSDDLANGKLRHVSEAFSEDPVRILRIAKFAARYAKWGFHVAHSTNKLMKQMVADGEVDYLVPERVWAELEGALAADQPSQFFKVLRGCGALAKIFPEIDQLYGVPQPEQHHAEVDTGVHTMMVLDQAAVLSSDTRVRFAALMHDLGKGVTPEANWPHHYDHEALGVELVKQLCERTRVPNEYRDLAVLTARYHGDCHRVDELKATTLVKVLEAMDAFRRPERVPLFVTACEADSRGRQGMENEPYPQAEKFIAVFEAANGIDSGGIAREAQADGLTGEAIGNRVHEARVKAVKAVLKETDDE